MMILKFLCGILANPAINGDTRLNMEKGNTNCQLTFLSIRKIYCIYSTLIFQLGECEIAAKALLDNRSVDGHGAFWL